MGIFDLFKPKVKKLNEKRDVDRLIGVLKNENSVGRGGAAIALGEVGDERAVEPLIQALKDKDEYVRIEAAIALGGIGDERAVDPLKQAIRQDESNDVRMAATKALAGAYSGVYKLD